MTKPVGSYSQHLSTQRSQLNKMRATLMSQVAEINGMIADIEIACELKLGHKPQEVVDASNNMFTRCSRCWKTLEQ